MDTWETFRAEFSPVAVAATLGVAAVDAHKFAERLLIRARDIDPNGEWSKLINRAPSRSWKTLKGDALVALDNRIAAEILLKFVDDLALNGDSEPVPGADSFGHTWHPLVERLSSGRNRPLDETLGDLGVSPHPRVVLAVEGESEEILVPRVFDELGLRRAPDLLRILCMRSDSRDLAMVIALTVAPILGERLNDGYWMVKPPTAVLVAVDPGEIWNTPAKIDGKRRVWIDEIKRVIKAQGGEVEDSELDNLVHVHVWAGTCFEFEHFTDEELAKAILQLHSGPAGMTLQALTCAVATVRADGKDIGKVWTGWNPQIRKPRLAEVLWPVLKEKIRLALNHPEVELPPIARVAFEAHELAQSFSFGRYFIKAPPDRKES